MKNEITLAIILRLLLHYNKLETSYLTDNVKKQSIRIPFYIRITFYSK